MFPAAVESQSVPVSKSGLMAFTSLSFLICDNFLPCIREG